MKQILIATHGKMASGIRSTLELVVGKMAEITTIDAYVNPEDDVEKMLQEYFSCHTEDRIFVFTDLKGGSVNQKMLQYAGHPRVTLITGMNLPVLLQIALAGENVTDKELQEFIKDARQELQMIYLNPRENGSVADEQNVIVGETTEKNQNLTASPMAPPIEEMNQEAANSQSSSDNPKENNPKESNSKKSNPKENIPETNISKTDILEINAQQTAVLPSGVNPNAKITALRVDDRLIHGQVAMTWTKQLRVQGIIVANNDAANDSTQKMALQMAVPSGIRVLVKPVDEVIRILSYPKACQMRILVLTRTVRDALTIRRSVGEIGFLNVGNVGRFDGIDISQKKVLSPTIMLTQDEIDCLGELIRIAPDTCMQQVPGDEQKLVKDVIGKLK